MTVFAHRLLDSRGALTKGQHLQDEKSELKMNVALDSALETPPVPRLDILDAPLDVVCVGMEEWDGVWRRSQNVMARLAKRHPNWRILFVGLSVDVPHLVKSGKLAQIGAQLGKTRPQKLDGYSNLWVVNGLEIWPERLPGGVAANEWLTRRVLRGALRKLGFRRPVLWLDPYYAAHLCGGIGEIGCIYDSGDDWSAMYPQNPVKARRVRAMDESLTRRADVMNVVSASLLEQKLAMRPDVNLIPNGVDVESYSAIQSGAIAPDPLTQNWPRPVIGHTGTLHPARFNLELTLEIARRFPDATVALIGPDFLPSDQREKLRALPNIRIVAPVEYHRLPSVMAGFDICFVPTLRNAFSESQNPLKLFEYLASGLPIVATPISGFRDHPDLVYLAEAPDEFAAQIERALAEKDDSNSDKSERRIALAHQNSWNIRVAAIEKVIGDLVAAKTKKTAKSGRN